MAKEKKSLEVVVAKYHLREAQCVEAEQELHAHLLILGRLAEEPAVAAQVLEADAMDCFTVRMAQEAFLKLRSQLSGGL